LAVVVERQTEELAGRPIPGQLVRVGQRETRPLGSPCPQRAPACGGQPRAVEETKTRELRRVDDQAAAAGHAWPEAIERPDGTLVGAVRVDPPTMALATDEEWHQASDAFADFVNTTLEFPIQIYSTTRSFPAEEYIGHYRERLTDPDAAENDQLRALIEEYTAWYEQELAQRQMTIRDHYILVPVGPDEVRYERASLLDRLTGLPVIGLLVEVWTAPSQSEERAAMVAELADRRERVARGMRDIQGCDTHRVPATDLTQLAAEYWTGTDLAYGTPEAVLRTTQIVHS
jgi:hypothetical protein